MQADDAAAEATADVPRAAAAAEAVVQASLGAVAAQKAGAIPVRGDYFTAEDLGPGRDGGAAASASDDDDDAVSSDGGEAEAPSDGAAPQDGEDEERAGSAAGVGTSDGNDSEDDEEGGYGAGGLSWEAVMAQVVGPVRPNSGSNTALPLVLLWCAAFVALPDLGAR